MARVVMKPGGSAVVDVGGGGEQKGRMVDDGSEEGAVGKCNNKVHPYYARGCVAFVAAA